MARARPGLEKAINEILERHGEPGRRLSLRQAERLTGLSPATIGELAKGNARTPETILRFALGMNEDADRLLLLAGFVPETMTSASPQPSSTVPASLTHSSESRGNWETEEQGWLQRFERALAKLPPGRERDLWRESLRHQTELIEAFARQFTADYKTAE